MQPVKLDIGWDLHGVLMNTTPIFKAMLYNKFGTYETKNLDSAGNERFKYSVKGASDQQIWNVIHKVLKEYTSFCEPFIDSMYVLHRLYQINPAPVNIITAQPKDCVDATEEWLLTYLQCEHVVWAVPPPRNDKELVVDTKSEEINSLGLTHYVEDRFKNASSIAKNCPGLEKVYLINKPYNIGRRTAEKVQRVDSALEILEDLKIGIE